LGRGWRRSKFNPRKNNANAFKNSLQSGINKAPFSGGAVECGGPGKFVRPYRRVSGPGLDMDVIPTLMVAAVFQNFTSNINIYCD
jgi:hypothetical protein